MKSVFGGTIAVILLGLYVYSVTVAIHVANCMAEQGCPDHTKAMFTDGMIQVLTLVGGLVSALVIAELAITKGFEVPMKRFYSHLAPEKQTAVKSLIVIYLVVWLVAGLAAFVVGQLQHPKVLQPLTDLGQSWLGIAVAAAYSYFGIDPKG